MRSVVAIVGGMFVLIGIYLFLARGRETATIIEVMASNTVRGIEALQGRS